MVLHTLQAMRQTIQAHSIGTPRTFGARIKGLQSVRILVLGLVACKTTTQGSATKKKKELKTSHRQEARRRRRRQGISGQAKDIPVRILVLVLVACNTTKQKSATTSPTDTKAIFRQSARPEKRPREVWIRISSTSGSLRKSSDPRAGERRERKR